MVVISELIKNLDLNLLTDEDYEDKEITGVYIGDLLSWVMGKAQPGNVWITIMSNINIVAVASLTDVACILLTEGVVPDENVIKKANLQGVVVLASQKTSYELAKELHTVIEL
ncbi:MAG: DRTGG domain-containing protein [Bacillota bacterium]|nr:DRTGG domain-containing protein [Bacillota bacterium]